jgi:hypothetical protein
VGLLLAVAGYIVALLLAPLFVVLPHELGHALTALGLGATSARIELGGPTRPLRLRLRGLELELRAFSGLRWAWCGRAFHQGLEPGRGRRIAVAAAGPAVSLLLAVAYTALALAAGRGIVAFVCLALALAAALSFFVTAPPIRYRRFFGPFNGSVSDGYRILSLLREE